MNESVFVITDLFQGLNLIHCLKDSFTQECRATQEPGRLRWTMAALCRGVGARSQAGPRVPG